jgi:hypothetical protein
LRLLNLSPESLNVNAELGQLLLNQPPAFRLDSR